jgi:transposase
MKDGRTHLAHKAEHAVDLDTGAVVAVTVQDADDGDTTTMQATLMTAAEQLEAVLPAVDVLRELVTDKGSHSNDRLVDLAAIGVRTDISEPDRGRRCWRNKPDARAAVYANRRRIRRPRGVRLLRRRGEYLERTFAHAYDTGGMRRTHLRGHGNILKRLLVHVSGFNLGLMMRTVIGVGTPRGLQGRIQALLATGCALVCSLRTRVAAIVSFYSFNTANDLGLLELALMSRGATCTRGC